LKSTAGTAAAQLIYLDAVMEVHGFIDLQVNGYQGVDFSGSDLTEERFASASRALLAHGTAGFLATIITSSEEIYQRNLGIMSAVMKRDEFQNRILGIHAEGPFLSRKPGAIGAHNPAWVKEPSPAFLDQLQDWAGGAIKMLTLAAELPGAEEVTKHAKAMGITVSLGHQAAKYEDYQRLAAAGAKAITHLGNGMPNEVHRHNNSLLFGLACEELAAMIITDGHHLPAHLIRTILRAKGVDNVIVTSDAAPLAGMPPGRYETLGNPVVLEKSGLLHNPDKKCMVGSSATMLECMNYLATLEIVTRDEMMKLGFYNPLRLIGIKPDSIDGLVK
jgi:N-acetylglucosamine-6-phosphate deacetylase